MAHEYVPLNSLTSPILIVQLNIRYTGCISLTNNKKEPISVHCLNPPPSNYPFIEVQEELD